MTLDRVEQQMVDFNAGTQTQLLDITSDINTVGKVEGVFAWDSTNKIPLWPTGALAADTWVNGVGAVLYTPV